VSIPAPLTVDELIERLTTIRDANLYGGMLPVYVEEPTTDNEHVVMGGVEGRLGGPAGARRVTIRTRRSQ
jgi:hypothetical protein